MHDPIPKIFCPTLNVAGGMLLLLLGIAAPAMVSAQSGSPAAEDSAETDDEREGRRPRRLRDALAVDPDAEWVPGQSTSDRSAELARKLSLGWRAFDEGDLLEPPNANALEFFREALEIDPGNGEAVQGVDRVAAALLAEARDRLAEGDESGAAQQIAVVGGFRPGHPDLQQLESLLARRAQLRNLLGRAGDLVAAGHIVSPSVDNAVTVFQSVLSLDDVNPEALAGLDAAVEQVIGQVNDMASRQAHSEALRLLQQAIELLPEEPRLLSLARSVAEDRDDRWQAQLQRLVDAIGQRELAQAERLLSELMDSGYAGDTAALLQRIDDLRELLSYSAGAIIRDDTPAGPGPALVVVAAGRFSMGSPTSEDDRFDREGPLREVVFDRPFALARSEISVAEYGRFVTATGYRTETEAGARSARYDESSGAIEVSTGMNWRLDFRGQPASAELPVLHLTHADALAYAQWLSEVTGNPYRLPSEAQFEYALRGGTTTRYWWGNRSPEERVENLTGARDDFDSYTWPDSFRGYGDGHWGPAPVASFVANPFGLFDMGGNVMEWTADCYSPNLALVPSDGAAVQVENCTNRTVRGGGWATPPAHSRSASRTALSTDAASCLVGFRVVRLL